MEFINAITVSIHTARPAYGWLCVHMARFGIADE